MITLRLHGSAQSRHTGLKPRQVVRRHGAFGSRVALGAGRQAHGFFKFADLLRQLRQQAQLQCGVAQAQLFGIQVEALGQRRQRLARRAARDVYFCQLVQVARHAVFITQFTRIGQNFQR